MGSRKMLVTAVAVVAVGTCVYLAGGGLLEPTAGPGSTMRTLDELYEISAGISQPKRYVTRASGQVPQAFVRFDGVDGESKDVDYFKWSEIVTFHQGQKLSIEGVGAARQVGSVGFDEMSVVKGVDKASPKLAQAVCTGLRFANVYIDVTQMTESGRVSYLSYELSGVVISSYNIVGSDLSSRPMEEVTLNFEEITMTYTERNMAGSH